VYSKTYRLLQSLDKCIVIDIEGVEATVPAAEVLDRVDERDQPIGTIGREDVFRLHANFRVAHVFIFNPANELLLQELAPTRARNPCRWGSSLAAYVEAGEDYAQAVRRRLRDELGIPDMKLSEIGKTRMLDEGCGKFIMLFEGRYAGPFVPDPSHIAKLEFLSLEQVILAATKDPERFTPTFLHLLDFYRRTRPL
jgi:isopentenyldiphosphate isomerase